MLSDTLAWIEPAAAAYGAIALFVVIYFESFGLPLPGESALIAAALLAARGDLPIAQTFLAALLGGVLGDGTGYLVGRFGGRPLLRRFGPLAKLTPDRLARLEDLVRRKGFLMVMTARFVVVLRQLNGIAAGSAGMPWRQFVLANVAGAALWTGFWVWGIYFFADHVRHLAGL